MDTLKWMPLKSATERKKVERMASDHGLCLIMDSLCLIKKTVMVYTLEHVSIGVRLTKVPLLHCKVPGTLEV